MKISRQRSAISSQLKDSKRSDLLRMGAVALVLLFLGGWPGPASGAPLRANTSAKELPMLVTVGELAAQPDQYHNHRIVVSGRVRSIEIQRGRRGSEYVMLILEEVASDAAESAPTVAVISLTLPKVGQGHHALVQGVYHREGRQGGQPFEHFIDAEVVLREES
jgi:hypothetical protein